MDTCMRKEGLDYEADVGDLFGRPGVSLGLEPPRDLGGGLPGGIQLCRCGWRLRNSPAPLPPRTHVARRPSAQRPPRGR